MVVKDSWSGLIYTGNLVTKPLHLNLLPPCLKHHEEFKVMAPSTLPQLQCLRGLIDQRCFLLFFMVYKQALRHMVRNYNIV